MASWTVAADAYDRVSATLAAGTNGTYDVTNVSAASVQMLAIVSSAYDPLILIKTLFGGSMKLDAPIVLSSPQIVSTFAPASIEIDNGSAKTVTVDVLVLRKAV